MHDTQIYTKTDAGREAIRARTLGLSMPVRAILLMVDGHKTVAAMRSIIAGSKAPADTLDALASQGLIEPLNGPVSVPAAAPAPAPPVVAPPVMVAPPEAKRPPALPTPVAAMTATSIERLDLELPTIIGPSASDTAVVTAPPVVESEPEPLVAEAPPGGNRYERLYAMMNEIVRDFLPAHRRYFFQLKIERCTSPDELLELLHDLRTALAKSRGDAFATEVVARLRSAAV